MAVSTSAAYLAALLLLTVAPAVSAASMERLRGATGAGTAGSSLAEPREGIAIRRELQNITPNPSTSMLYDVIVVGAGVAGLAAARNVTDSNSSYKVLVLEARDRVGGRVHTVNCTSGSRVLPVDVGAAWIHGVSSNGRGLNPLASLAAAAGQSYTSLAEDGVSYTSTGSLTPQADVDDQDDLGAYFYDYEEAFWDSSSDTSLSLNTLFNRYISSEGLTNREQGLLHQHLVTEVVAEYAADLTELSALYYAEDQDWGGPDALLYNGYAPLARHLARNLDISLNRPVTRVNTSRSSSGEIYVTAGGSTYKAKYVIITLPLAYLQAQHTNIFKPALPSTKVTAINSLGMGVLNKVVMVWDSAWWSDLITVEWITLKNNTNPGAWSEYYNVYATQLQYPVLIAFNFASFARSQESLTDQQQTEAALRPLRRILPAGRTIPTPRQVLVTRWASDPWTLGSYSFAKTGFKPSQRTDLAAPTANNRLLWAGEHTHAQYPATVHGAFLSGQREGARVVNALRTSG